MPRFSYRRLKGLQRPAYVRLQRSRQRKVNQVLQEEKAKLLGATRPSDLSLWMRIVRDQAFTDAWADTRKRLPLIVVASVALALIIALSGVLA